MVVGVCVLELRLPGCRSLKDKRRILKSVVDRLRSRFNVAVAELEHMDAWQEAVLGICTVANSGTLVDQVLSKAAQLVEAEDRLIVSRVTTERL